MASVRKRTWTTGGEIKVAWVVDYKDQGGRRRLKTFERKKDADAYVHEVSHDVRQGTHVHDSESLTISAAADLWLAYCRAGDAEHEPLEKSTVREYENHVKQYIRDPDKGIGGLRLTQLDMPRIQQFEKRWLEAAKSRAMLRKVRGSLSALLSFAQEQKLVGRHVLREAVKRRRGKRRERQKAEVVIPTKEELRSVLSAATGRLRALLVTAIFTGLRASEFRGLAWSNVVTKDRIIRVRQRADRWNQIGPPKSEAGNRDIPLAPIVINVLKEWRLACPRGDLDLVFPNGEGNVESLANLYNREFAPLQIACGIAIDTGKVDEEGKPILRAKYGFHTLRHAAASLFIEEGWTPKKLQKVMGHSSIQITFDTYGHLFPSPDDDQAAMARVEARLVG